MYKNITDRSIALLHIISVEKLVKHFQNVLKFRSLMTRIKNEGQLRNGSEINIDSVCRSVVDTLYEKNSVVSFFILQRDKDPYRYKVRQKTEIGQTPLNPNHSYFVLVDNGMRNEPHSEVEVRCGIEDILSKNGLPAKGELHRVSSVVSRVAHRHRGFGIIRLMLNLCMSNLKIQ